MHNTPIMSLDNFFAHTGLMKKKDGHKKGGRGNANANATHASHDNELDPEGEVAHKANLTDDEEPNVHRDKLIVESVTASIEKMLDSKLANIIKPFNEVSGKLDSVIERMGTVEERVSDLEDVSAATALRVGALEVQLKKALDRLENLENLTGTINIYGGNVSFYQDFSTEVVRKRKETANARRLLREAGISYHSCTLLSSESFTLMVPVPPSPP